MSGPLFGMPGIGGGLGYCIVCGSAFVVELLLNTPIPTVEIPGIIANGIEGASLCVHRKCLEQLEVAKGTGWENLPDGPLRACYAKAAAHDEGSA